jgi:hypothetical protein
MQDIVTTLAHKHETVLGTVGLSRIAAPGTRLRGIVGIDFHGHALMLESFVGDVAMQFGKGPFGRMPIGVMLLLTRLFPMLEPVAFTDVCQVLQADETVWVLGDNAMTDLVVGILFQPSLPSAHHQHTAGSGTGAFLLQPFSQSRIMIGFGSYSLARIEGGVIGRG